MVSFTKYQEEFLLKTKARLDKPLSEEIEEAYLDTPRHLFVKEYLEFDGNDWQKIVVTEKDLEQQLYALYADTSLTLMVNSEKYGPSSISQPSLVLGMLDLLQIKRGQKILEIGAASGWNASMLGKLTGPYGHVYSIEIIPELAERAREMISCQKITNVTIIEGDGGYGYGEASPYDRIIFTAGSFDMPSAFYSQLKEEGLLLMILKNKGGWDNLFLFKKVNDHFESLSSSPCAFVPLTGEYKMTEQLPIDIGSIPSWAEIENQVIFKEFFWWGYKSLNKHSFVSKTLAVSSFLSIVEPLFEVFQVGEKTKSAHQRLYFGLVDHENKSIALFKDDLLIGYGNDKALKKLKADLYLWLEKGMPGAACFELKVYPAGTAIEPEPGQDQWLTRRRDSQFLWTLPCLSESDKK